MSEIPDAVVIAAAKATSLHFYNCDEGDTWQDCAKCCGVVEHTQRVLKAAAPAITDRARCEERTSIARLVRSYFAAADDPLYEDVRILCGRIERGEHA